MKYWVKENETLNKIANSILKAIGKETQFSGEFSGTMIAREILRRGWTLLNGLVRFRRMIFVGKGVSVRGRNVRFGRYVSLERFVEVNTESIDGIEFGDHCKIGAYTIISATNSLGRLGKGVKIGAHSGIGQFSFIGASGGVVIGSRVIMGQYVSFHASNHVFIDNSKPIKDQGTTARGIVIEDNVWIGAKSTFLDGSVVRHSSVVAAGAVVSGEFPPSVVIGGVPAKVLRVLQFNKES